MNRLLIERIEGRVLLGVTMFVAIMILVGWVAINEPARMAAFERQHTGRSIERGAELFAANCTSCHGTAGLGIVNRAPALNSPHLFGHDFLNEVNGNILTLERRVSSVESLVAELNTEREALFAEAGQNPSDARRAEIVARFAEIDALLAPSGEGSLQAEIEVLQAELEPLYEERLNQIVALTPAIDAGYFPGLDTALAAGGPALTAYLSEDYNRLVQIGWGSDLRNYLTTTLIHGRPGSIAVWGSQNQMVAWAQQGGGGLRADQIDDLVNYILNWDKGNNWDVADLYAVNQFAKIPISSEFAQQGPAIETVGTDVDAILMTIADEGIVGDPVRGETLYTGGARTEANVRLACSSCHLGGVQGPATDVTWETAMNVRINQPELAGYTVEQYLIESIVAPNSYIVAPYASGVMPANYGEQLSHQDIADILAYVESYTMP